MKYILNLIFGLYMVIDLISSRNAQFEEVIAFLLIVAIDIYRMKYKDSLLMTWIEFAIICIASIFNPIFYILLCNSVFDLARKRSFWGIFPMTIVGFYFAGKENYQLFSLVIPICVAFGLKESALKEKDNKFKETYDRERRYRYELEETKQKLINSAGEAVHMAEIKERNRIAREIHDNVGHSIAGIHMQLQAALKLFHRDKEKSESLLRNSIEGLSDSLTLLRNTVYNIKPRETLGLEYIIEIINKFKFCKVEFKHTGDFNVISAQQLEVLSTNIKEALTNASKYSGATMVNISIDINEKYIRLYIKDNGTGCTKIKEGLGLSGMRERVMNMGGSMSISSEDGFLIVCLIHNTGEGSDIVENSYSRR